MALTNEQYNDIMRSYAADRAANRDILMQRRKEVYTKIPEYRELSTQRSQSVLTALRHRFGETLSRSAEASASLPAPEDAKAWAAAKQELLQKAGLPADYLDPIYTCPYCRDTGYVGREKCRCFRQKEIALLYDQSHLKQLIRHNRFDLLSETYYRGEDLRRFQRAAADCRRLAERFSSEPFSLYLYGPAGTGKSFLSICCADALLKQGYSVLYFSAVSLFAQLSVYGADAATRAGVQTLHRDLTDADLVIIDDLGTELTNSFTSMELFTILNERLLAEKATIISSNLELEEVRSRYSDRIFSRICSGFVMHKLTGEDIRLQKIRNLSQNTATP